MIMHLLNAETLRLHHFLGEVPKYAILSHTWGPEEVLFRDISKTPEQLKEMTGYAKILGCCAQAKAHNIDYVWIDTCCINSDSSAELSEAINSMYTWYREAEICYAYLSDTDSEGGDLPPRIEKSRWFTRG